LAVAVYHTILYTGLAGTAALAFPQIFALVRNGFLGVPIFIVLSGFVLMLPVVRSGAYRLPKGLKNFIFRRFRRIVPPYWVALILSITLIALVPVMRVQSGTQWDNKIPITTDDVVGHFLLIQNFLGGITKINGPMWSVSIEWQIYFLMPLMLLPLWRRFGAWFTISVVAALSLAPSALIAVHELTGRFDVLVPLAKAYARQHPWFVLLFALGMVAAELAGNPEVRAKWLWLPTLVVGAFVYLWADFAQANRAVSETLVGVAIALLLVWLAKNTSAATSRLLSSAPLVRLGGMSYSIYLIHSPLLALGNMITLPIGLQPGAQLALMYFVVLPLALLASWMFHLLVERHFMTAHQSELRSART